MPSAPTPVAYARLLLDLARRPGRRLARRGRVPSRLAPVPRSPHRRDPHRATPGGRHAPHPLAPVCPTPVRPRGRGPRRRPGRRRPAGAAVKAQEKPKIGNLPAAVVKAKPVIPPSRTIKGVVLDSRTTRVSGVIVVGGLTGTGTPNHQIFTTDSEGRFSWPIPAGGNLGEPVCSQTRPGSHLLDAMARCEEDRRRGRAETREGRPGALRRRARRQ